MDEIFYRKKGKGYPLLFIHGFCESHEIWNEFIEAISPRFEVFTVDLPGFGASPLPTTPFSIDDIGKQLANWLDRQHIQKPIVIGHSLGGYVALSMARTTPMAGLCLFHSTAFADSEENKINRNRVIEFVKTNGVDSFIDTFVPGLFFNKNHPAISVVDKIARSIPAETILAYTAAMRDRPSSVEVFKNLEIPLLILGGAHDTIILPEVAYELEKLNRHATVKILDHTAHEGMFENVSESQQAIIDFALAAKVN